jgi:hypothetical protein
LHRCRYLPVSRRCGFFPYENLLSDLLNAPALDWI